MIVAVPTQVTVHAGPPERLTTLTWWRWACTACRIEQDGKCSHPDMALDRGDQHAQAEQCHTVGQLELFALAVGGR